MPIYRLSAEVIIDAPDAAQAADKLRDALCEVDGEVDCISHVEVSEEPRTIGLSGLWQGFREAAPEVSDQEVA